MIPVVTPEEMAAVDAAAPEPVGVLIARAGAAVAAAALDLLGGASGRRVVVVVGPGNNGNDGRAAAELLERRGVRVTVHEAASAPAVLEPADLVVDAAFGTGFRGTYGFPDPDGAPVLAVDIPSGVDGLTGLAAGAPAPAVATVTFAALKPGLLQGAGPAHCGEVRVADIGLDVSGARIHLVEDADVVAWIPERAADDHKWRRAVWVVAGSPGMTGAARLCASAALRGGAGYVRLSVPGDVGPPEPVEAVHVPFREADWSGELGADADRFAAVAIGPGLGRADGTAAAVRRAATELARPLVLDGDALAALGSDAPALLAARTAPTVLTPHDGEFERLTGAAPGPDRVAAARDLAAATGAVVLLKGPTTTVAAPDGAVLLVRAGDARLATAGTGDVLTGLVAAHLASGADPLRAAAAAAHVHGLAARCGPSRGLVAGDLPELVPVAWELLLGGTSFPGVTA
ncbi:MAG: NAD(P)H-hydrate dehydratase [Microthrixaceae bacterium]